MVTFKLIETKNRRKEVEKAIDIYLSTIDIETSYTNTNQIKEHIFSDDKSEKRQLFFYNLYMNNELFGFAEFGYLPKTETLVIDYICTKKRNHCAFYTFYQLCIEEISNKLAHQNYHFKYIITEISLAQNNGLYCDVDSNYFRKMLSINNFVLLKYPYYQPSFEGKQFSFSIAIKSTSESSVNSLLTDKEYISIVEELYYSHYGTWYKHYYSEKEVDTTIEKLLNKIKREISPQKDNNNISLVNCPVFEAGNCKNVDIEPITLSKKIKKSLLSLILIIFWFVITIACIFVAVFYQCVIVERVLACISAISGIITIVLFLRTLFRN